MSSIKFLLSFNIRFDYPNDNPIMLTLVTIHDDVSCQELIERLILLFNRNSKIKHFEKQKNSFFLLLNSRSSRISKNKFNCEIFR